MSSPTNDRTAVRRSGRQHRPFVASRRFPSIGDEICVKWILGSRIVWWPATLISIQSVSPSSRKCSGELLYHKLGDYAAVQTTVIFTTSAESQRFVSSVISSSDHRESDPSSWIFSSESINDLHDKEKAEPRTSGRRKRRLPSLSAGTHAKSSATLALRSQTIQRPRRYSALSKSILEASASREGRALGKTSNLKSTVIGPSNNDDISPTDDLNDQVDAQNVGKGIQSLTKEQPKEEIDIRFRLRLIEQQLLNGNMLKQQYISPSAMSVIVSLRWALLKTLEKPLKVMHLPDLSQHGLARHDLTVTAQCDYYTFREIAAVLWKEHRYTSDNSSNSRVAFSPSFNTTQSGSSASSNMNILFSCLSDLTSFLRIRDDMDFERILSKEVLSEKSAMLRLLGTFSIDKIEDIPCSERQTHCTDTTDVLKSTDSVSASSENFQMIRLFVGTSPINYVRTTNLHAGNFAEGKDTHTFNSTIFQQHCKHFCSSKKCFQTPWMTINIRSQLSVSCEFHLDGTVPEEQLTNFFLINWKRQISPSFSKWTMDVQDVGNNTPGSIRLSVPVIYFTSSRNVSSIASLLDNHIETFMRVRSEMHSFSSFK